MNSNENPAGIAAKTNCFIELQNSMIMLAGDTRQLRDSVIILVESLVGPESTETVQQDGQPTLGVIPQIDGTIKECLVMVHQAEDALARL